MHQGTSRTLFIKKEHFCTVERYRGLTYTAVTLHVNEECFLNLTSTRVSAKILGHSRNTCAREVLEAFFINMKSDSCVNEASILLYGAKVSFKMNKVR